MAPFPRSLLLATSPLGWFAEFAFPIFLKVRFCIFLIYYVPYDFGGSLGHYFLLIIAEASIFCLCSILYLHPVSRVADHASPASLVTQFTLFDLVKDCVFTSSALSASELSRGLLSLLAFSFCTSIALLGSPTPLYLLGGRKFNPSLLLSFPRRLVCAGSDLLFQSGRATWLSSCKRFGASDPLFVIVMIRLSYPSVGICCQRFLLVLPYPRASTFSSRGIPSASHSGTSSELFLHEMFPALLYLMHASFSSVLFYFITPGFPSLSSCLLLPLPLSFMFAGQALLPAELHTCMPALVGARLAICPLDTVNCSLIISSTNRWSPYANCLLCSESG